MNDTAITTARALFPRGLHQPQDSYRFGADALLLAAFAAESLASLPGTAPRKVAELGSGCGAALLGLCLYLSSGTAEMPEHCHRQTRCPANAPARSLQKHPPLPLADSRREKAAEDTTLLTCTLWGWSRTRPYALRPRQTPAFWGWKIFMFTLLRSVTYC